MTPLVNELILTIRSSKIDKTIAVTTLRRRLGAICEEVARDGVPYTITRYGKPVAVLIYYETYLQFQQLHEAEVLERFDQLVERLAAQNAHFSEEEVEADIQAKHDPDEAD